MVRGINTTVYGIHELRYKNKRMTICSIFLVKSMSSPDLRQTKQGFEARPFPTHIFTDFAQEQLRSVELMLLQFIIFNLQ